ncbi:alpha/beta fold hydrolase [Dyella sp.]|uniref:alpha/beta hydrolase family protein n=1 Tax=Dyella sp. TaxID=1869338 RepID=UPI0039C8A42D
MGVTREAPSDQAPEIVPVVAADGARFEMMLVQPPAGAQRVVHWLPAMGVPARHYLPLAQALAGQGVAMAIHEWRGIGSSDRRAGRRTDWGYRELLECDLPASVAALRARVGEARHEMGGHSLGGQLAFLYAALHPDQVDALLLVASGSPYWRRFRHGWLIRQAYTLAPLLARLRGHLPGRRLGFAGNEARGVITDWSRTGRTGRYAARGIGDLDAALARLRKPVLAMRLRDDWLAPASSQAWLLDKLPASPACRLEFGREALAGEPAGHFAWMRAPAAIADAIARWDGGRNSPFAQENQSTP